MSPSTATAFFLVAAIAASAYVPRAAADFAGAAAATPQAGKKRAFASDHIMLQAAVEKKQKNGIVKKAAKAPSLKEAAPQVMSEDLCESFSEDASCPAMVSAASHAAKGSSRIQKKTVVKKVMMNLVEDDE